MVATFERYQVLLPTPPPDRVPGFTIGGMTATCRRARVRPPRDQPRDARPAAPARTLDAVVLEPPSASRRTPAQTPHTADPGPVVEVAEFPPRAPVGAPRRPNASSGWPSCAAPSTSSRPATPGTATARATGHRTGPESQFGTRLVGIDVDEVVAMGLVFVDEQPRTFKPLGDHLLARWPDHRSLRRGFQTACPWCRSPAAPVGRGTSAHASSRHGSERTSRPPTLEPLVLRYLGVEQDASSTSGVLARLSEVVDRLPPPRRIPRSQRFSSTSRAPRTVRRRSQLLYDFEALLLWYPVHRVTLGRVAAQQAQVARARSHYTSNSSSTDVARRAERTRTSPVHLPPIVRSGPAINALADEGALLATSWRASLTRHPVRVTVIRPPRVRAGRRCLPSSSPWSAVRSR